MSNNSNLILMKSLKIMNSSNGLNQDYKKRYWIKSLSQNTKCSQKFLKTAQLISKENLSQISSLSSIAPSTMIKNLQACSKVKTKLTNQLFKMLLMKLDMSIS